MIDKKWKKLLVIVLTVIIAIMIVVVGIYANNDLHIEHCDTLHCQFCNLIHMTNDIMRELIVIGIISILIPIIVFLKGIKCKEVYVCNFPTLVQLKIIQNE